MTKIQLRQQTQYNLINKILLLNKTDSVRITYGRAVLQTRLAKINLLSDKINDTSFYVCAKADVSIPAKDVMYEAEKTLNAIIGWGSDQVYMKEKDIDCVAQSDNTVYYFIELEGK